MSKIKIFTFALLLAAAFALAASPAWAQVRGSKHDLGSGGGAQQTTGTTSEVCVFCHTPHGSDSTVNAPLWNKVLPAPTSYNRYSSLGTASLDGEEAPVGSVSLACLSCHDGSQAMDVVLNAPNSGLYNAGGTQIDTLAIGNMTGDPTTPGPGGTIPNLGVDLRNDHPVSIAYAGGACIGATALCTPSSATNGDPDFQDAQTTTLNLQRVWWVDTGTVGLGTREKTDMILYTRPFLGPPTAGDGPSVECGSCHDPHEAAVAPAVSFMRIPNANSDVCLACHVK